MKHSKGHKSTGAKTPISRNTKKQEINLQKNTVVYFQIGLILCLLGTYALLEMQTRRTLISTEALPADNGIIEVTMTDVMLEPVKKKEPKKESVSKSARFEEMEKMKRIEKIGSNSAFWPLLGAIGIYSWSSGCLPINFDFGGKCEFFKGKCKSSIENVNFSKENVNFLWKI